MRSSKPVTLLRPIATLAALPALLLMSLASPAHAGDVATIGAVSLTDLHSPDATGALASYATGAAASILLLEPDEEVALGGELRASFLSGRDERRIYDLGVSFIISYGMKHKPAVPFMRLGLDLASVGARDLDLQRQRSIMAGVHGAAGFHGFLSRRVYWRAELGFLGAGPGGVTGGLSLGYTISEL